MLTGRYKNYNKSTRRSETTCESVVFKEAVIGVGLNC